MRRFLLLTTVMLGAFCAMSSLAVAQERLMPGEVVILTCAEEPELNGEYTITQSGLILLKFIGAVEVAGLTEQQASEKIAKILVEQQILVKATVTLARKDNKPTPVRYGGAVRLSGELPYTEGLTLKDVLEVAQPTSVADLTQVRITRATGEVGTIDYTQFLAGNMAANPLMRPGDQVFVPLKVASLEVLVVGAVNKPGLVEFTEGMTVKDAIELAGGLRSDANARAVEHRSVDVRVDIIDLESSGSEAKLKPGDTIAVPIREVRETVYVRGAVARPGLIPYTPGMTVSNAVKDASPFENARLDRVKIVRRSLDRPVQNISVNVRNIWEEKTEDVVLIPGDIVEVPYPSKSYSTENALRIVGIGLLLYFIFRR